MTKTRKTLEQRRKRSQSSVGLISRLSHHSPLLLFTLIVVIGGYTLFNVNSGTAGFYNITDPEIERVVKLVADNNLAEIIRLEENEPVVATVVDKELTRQQDPEFYAEAEEGDKIIILNSKRIIILYRESEDRIINIGSGVLALSDQN